MEELDERGQLGGVVVIVVGGVEDVDDACGQAGRRRHGDNVRVHGCGRPSGGCGAAGECGATMCARIARRPPSTSARVSNGRLTRHNSVLDST